jgi:general secretion pathway protein A
MYQAHWGLRLSPFTGGCDPQFFYSSPTHDEALARLFFLLEENRRLGLLMGPAGSGKSMLLTYFARQLRRRGVPVARMSLVGVQPVEMLAMLASQFAVPSSPTMPLAILWRALADRLAEHRFQQVDTVVLLDDADQAAPAVLGQVSRLVIGDATPDARLTVVLAGQHERIGRIGRRLLDRADLRIDLTPWEAGQTAEYLVKSLAQAGCESAVFDESAIERLHALARGIPRRVSQLADMSLLAGAGRALSHIDAETVESVFDELGVLEA